ncbi:MAG: MFS transporter [Deltaproteobacteria bacterium]|nr:MFS transporter [Deltaproteobacteria bacterium]
MGEDPGRVSPARLDRDLLLLYLTAFLRALSTGLIGVLLGIYLAKLRFDAAQIGYVIAAGLAGGACATLLVTLIGDRFGRKRALVCIAVLGAMGGLAASVASTFSAILAAAFLGMLNGMGRDRGAALVLEQAILPATATDGTRTQAFAWYNVLQDAGHAIGSLLAGAPYVFRAVLPVDEIASFRLAVGLAAVFLLITAVLYLYLSPAMEVPAARTKTEVSPRTRRILFRISSLFAVDALAGGFLVSSLLSYFFYRRFGVAEGTVAVLFFAARTLNAFSHLGAAWLAKRIGLVKTMVFTHIPSSVFLLTVPFAQSFPVAAALFLLREGLVEMDVPTRQSYVMAVVRPEERTVASGVTHLVRVGAWAVAPSFAGALMQGVSLGIPIMIGAGMKIAYDLLLYAAFRKAKPPEETATAGKI